MLNDRPLDDASRLQRCVDDLTSILATTSNSAADPAQVGQDLADKLLSALQTEFVYVRLTDPYGGASREVAHGSPIFGMPQGPRGLAAALAQTFGPAAARWPASGHLQIGATKLSVAVAHIGTHGDLGTIVAGSSQSGFPQPTDKLILGVAANQTAMLLHELGGGVTDKGTSPGQAGLQRNEARLVSAGHEMLRTIDNIPVDIRTYNADGSYEALNTTARRLAASVSVDDWRDWIHPDDIDRIERKWQACLASGEPFEMEYRSLAGGDYRWQLSRRVPDHDGSGRIVRWYAINTDIDDHKRAEARLAAAERETRSTLDSLPTIAWRGGANGYVLAPNQSWFEYTGTTPEQIRGARWKSCVHPDDLDQLVEIGRQYVAAGVPIDGEARLRRHDGEYRWFLFRPSPARDQSGNIVGWNGSAIDIEDRKRAEQAVAASEYNLQTMIDTIPALAWSALPDGTAIFTNKHYQDFVGLSLEQLQGLGWTTLVHPDDLGELTAAWQSMMEAGQGGEVEARFRRHDGEYRRLLFRTNPLRDGSGRVVRWYGVNTDIEDRKRAEERLRRSEASLAAGQRVSRTGTFTWQVDTDELVFSEELYRIFEYELMSPVTFALVRARFHPEDVSALSERMKMVRSGHTPPDQDVRLQMPDGRVKHLRTVGQMIAREDGRPEYLGAIQDVTERRLAEEARDKTRTELAHVTRIMSLSAVTASIAHEVNQPLSGIVTNASTCLRMLAADPQNVEGAREAARRMIRDGNRAADVISRLRALFSGKSISKEVLDLKAAAREVLSIMFADLVRNRITLVAQIDGNRPLLVKGDRVQLQQVILNLVRNAMDAMRETSDRPRHLIVSADTDEEGRARLSVSDTGVGFEQHAERIFDAFYTTKEDGMGIGLSVSRSIIETHGGILRAISNDEHGATVFFAIPRENLHDLSLGAADTTQNGSNVKSA